MENQISLYSLEQAAVILLSEDGVVYSNQAGGSACMQPREKGFLIPISNDPPLADLHKSSLPFKLMEVCRDLIGIDSEVADALDSVLAAELEYPILVDRSRIGESMEAWVYVLFDERKGLLTWPNSD
jgi:hypothetical protein